ncbi:MAG TPA: hypothetical protein VHM02_15685 [Thermoanaerobaculia bacterium]|nr:hypothetical protein [Thermoanaerobaculia bacterium]
MTATASTAAGSASLASLQEQYFYLDKSFNRLFLATTSDEQRNTLRTDYVQARDNYWHARTRSFNDDDPMVADLQKRIGAAQKEIARAGRKLDDVAGVLDLITNAVNLGSRLVALAAR